MKKYSEENVKALMESYQILKEKVEKLEKECIDISEDSILVIHDLGAENIVLKERIKEITIIVNYPQIFFTVQWMCKNTSTEQVNVLDLETMKALADRCHIAYLKET